MNSDHMITRVSSRRLPAVLCGLFALLLIALLAWSGHAAAATMGSCSGISFPYTLSASSNAARVAELRNVIDCANANSSDDVIDLGGFTLSFADGAYSSSVDPHGVNALPVISGNLALRNGALERSPEAVDFRLLQSLDSAFLRVEDVTFRNGVASDEGGAILAAGVLDVRGSAFEHNRAPAFGGAVSASSTTADQLLIDSRFSGNVSPQGAAIAVRGAGVVTHSRLLGNGDASSLSVVWVDCPESFGIVDSLLADNVLSANGSSLFALGANAAQAASYNTTITGNALQAAMFHAAPSQTVTIANSIIRNNTYASLGTASVIYSIVQEAALVTAGSGNHDADPGFVDAAGGDYRLGSGSVAIDAGHDQYVLPDFLDVDGDAVTNEMMPDLDFQPRLIDDANVLDSGVSLNGLPIIDIGALERQADSAQPAVTVSPVNGLITTEAGATASFSMVLTGMPSADVTVALSSSNLAEGTLSAASLVFTASNWNIPQTVVVTGIDDAVADGDVAYTVATAPASSADMRYANRNPPDIQVLNTDDEVASWAVGGTVTGLLGSSLELSLNSGEQTLALHTNGSFAFPSPLASGTSYSVAIASQPSSPTQNCALSNASGTVANQDVADIVVNCGPATTYSVGGTLSGLATGGSVTLSVNGAHPLTLAANGAWFFPLQFAPGDSYVVEIALQPQGQHCALANASGTVATANVTKVSVDCESGGPLLTMSVDDGSAYARYGYVRDYYVTLNNSGNGDASNVQLSASFASAFDVANVQWICINGSAGATCGGQGSGGFTDIAYLPAGTTLAWIVSVPVYASSTESSATFRVDVSGTSGAEDTDTLVIFRDGFDQAYGAGLRGESPGASTSGLEIDADGVALLRLKPDLQPGIRIVGTLVEPGFAVAVQQLTITRRNFVRLSTRAPHAGQQLTRWTPVAAGAPLAFGIAEGAGDKQWILLEGAQSPLILVVPSPDSGASSRP